MSYRRRSSTVHRAKPIEHRKPRPVRQAPAAAAASNNSRTRRAADSHGAQEASRLHRPEDRLSVHEARDRSDIRVHATPDEGRADRTVLGGMERWLRGEDTSAGVAGEQPRHDARPDGEQKKPVEERQPADDAPRPDGAGNVARLNPSPDAAQREFGDPHAPPADAIGHQGAPDAVEPGEFVRNFSSWLRPGESAAAATSPEPQFVNFEPQKPVDGRLPRVLGDVEAHLPAGYGTQYRDSDPVTWAHETTHGINSHLRNHMNNTGRPANGFYVGENRAIILPEPKITKSSVAPFVPQSLRGSRFDMYVNGQRAFERQPLYLFDEWTAYTNGGAAGVDMAKNGQWNRGGRDAVTGQVEFTGYAFAVGAAIERQDPNYFKENPQFKEFLAWQGLRAMDGYREGSKVPDFRLGNQDKIVDSFKNSPDAQPLRDFITRTYGADYLTRLLDGPGVQPTQDNKPRPPVEVRPKPPVDNRPQPPVDNRPQPPVDNRPQPPQDNRPQPPVEVRPQPVQPPSPGSDPYADRSRYATFIDYPRQGDGTLFGDKGAKVADVAAHIKPELMPWVRSQILSQGFDTVTKVHETIHGIDADISTKRNGRAVEGFYLGDGKAAQVENPAIRKSDVGRFVPESLRESRYKTYLSGQPQYEDRPFKVMQEWNSYIHESEAAVDMVKAGKYRDGGMDAVKGSLEFTAYSFSAAMAAERLDPEGFKNNQNLKDFMAFQGVRAMDAYRAGKDMPEFKGYGMDRFVDSFKNSPDAQPLRDFITRTYGNEYLTRLLDGPGVQPPQDVKPQPVAPPQPVTPRPEPVTVGARPGQKPPEVNAEGWLNADGTPSLANRQGQVTVVEFWGTFCPPCRTSIPHLNEIQEKYKDKGLQVLALTGEDRATVERFAQGTRMNYAVGYGSNTSEAYGVSGVPHAVVVGRDGKVAYAGHPGDEAFDAAIKGAVEAPAPVPEVKPQPQPQPQPEPPRPAEDRFKDYKIGYQSDKVRTAHGSFLETMQGRLDETRLKRFDRMMVEFERRMGDRAYQRLLAGQDSGQVHREIESTIADTYQHLGEMVSAPDASRNVFDQKSRTFLAENFMLHAADPATYDQGGEGSCWLQAGTIATGWINHADGLARFMKEVTLTGDYTSLNQGRGNSSPRTYTFNRGIFALRGSTAAWTLDNALGGSARSPVGKILDEGLSAMLGRRSPYAGTYGEVAQVMYMVTGDTPASGTNGNQQRTLLEKGAYINYWPGHMLSQQLRREGDRWLIVQDNQWGERSDYVIARINDLRSWDARSEGRRGFEHFNPGGGGDNPLGPYLPNPNVGPPIPGGYNPQPAPGPGPGPGNPPGPGPRPWSPPGPGPGPGPGFVPGIGGGIGGGSGISGGIGSGYDLLHLLYMLMGLMEQGSIDPNMMAMISRLLSGPNGPALLQMLSAGQAAPQFLPPVAAMPGAANVPPAM